MDIKTTQLLIDKHEELCQNDRHNLEAVRKNCEIDLQGIVDRIFGMSIEVNFSVDRTKLSVLKEEGSTWTNDLVITTYEKRTTWAVDEIPELQTKIEWSGRDITPTDTLGMVYGALIGEVIKNMQGEKQLLTKILECREVVRQAVQKSKYIENSRTLDILQKELRRLQDEDSTIAANKHITLNNVLTSSKRWNRGRNWYMDKGDRCKIVKMGRKNVTLLRLYRKPGEKDAPQEWIESGSSIYMSITNLQWYIANGFLTTAVD